MKSVEQGYNTGYFTQITMMIIVIIMMIMIIMIVIINTNNINKRYLHHADTRRIV